MEVFDLHFLAVIPGTTGAKVSGKNYRGVIHPKHFGMT